ncbi:MAG: 1-acyl-sn-glycerol-3-phosphate acyltransferase [Alphaproteobacteria bacterium]|nr:1-acyl-sn-glycerol-3-phosphate acyltransferase [Alphaproteobacteria bacterium]
MRFLRSCLTIFCFGLFGLGGLIIGTIVFPVLVLFLPVQKQRPILSNIVHYTWIFFVKVMVSLRLINVKVTGMEKIKDLKGHIIVANHPTLLDVVLIISSIPNTICIVKSTLAKNFFIKHLIQRIYLLNDDNPEYFLTKGQEILSQGINIIIFPEGTRTNSDNPLKIHRGFAQLAVRSKAPILPVRIDCVPIILDKKQKWYDIGVKTAVYHVRFLDPISGALTPDETFHHRAKILSEKISLKLFKRIH